MEKGLTVGRLAKIAGLTVRALHYYEQVGLLAPALRESNNYRVYSEADVKKLQQISILKSLGFSLENIKKHISDPKFALAKLLPMQIEQLRIKIQREEILLGKLKAMEYYGKNPSPLPMEGFFKIMNQLKNVTLDFSEEEWKVVKAQGKKLGDAHIRAVEAEWPELIKKVQGFIKDGVDPKNPRVAPLAKRWMELVKEFTGGHHLGSARGGRPESGQMDVHKRIEQKVGNMYKEQNSQITMGDPSGANMMECISYIQKALK